MGGKPGSAVHSRQAYRGPMKRKATFCVYMLLLSNGNVYTGYTRDLRSRYLEHGRGRGGRYTRSFRPVKILQCWHTYGTRASAMKVEAFIKTCSRREKDRLIAEPVLLPQLLRRRRGHRIRLEPFVPFTTEEPAL
jgi:putative endonuclease